MDLLVARFDAVVVAPAVALAMLAAWGLGTLMGQRLHRIGSRTPSKFDDASIALMGLLLAFAFGMSISKHEQRRMAVVADSNAIGDFYTCATLLKEPTRTKLQGVIKQYAELRLSLTRKRASAAEFENALSRIQQAHAQMTELVAQALSEGTPIAVPLTNTLNDVSSKHAARVAAVNDRLPATVAILLIVSAIVTTMLIGREQGATGSPEVAGTLTFILLVSLAIYVIFDLNQPQRGLTRVSQEPIERLISSMSH